MNTKILQKCITELKTEQPKIDYVLGMLETLMEMTEPVRPTPPAKLSIESVQVPAKIEYEPGIIVPQDRTKEILSNLKYE